jgi:hypothetical protein
MVCTRAAATVTLVAVDAYLVDCVASEGYCAVQNEVPYSACMRESEKQKPKIFPPCPGGF